MDVLVIGGTDEQGGEGGCERICSTACGVVSPTGRQESDPSPVAALPASSSGADEAAAVEVCTIPTEAEGFSTHNSETREAAVEGDSRGELTEAIGEEDTSAFPADDSGGEAIPSADEEQAVPRLSKQALESLLDESTGKLVALKDSECEVDDRARENEWLGKHTPISLAVFRAELDRTGKCTFNVDENGVLLDDPVKYRLARKAGAQITLRVRHGLSEAKKSNFILLTQGRERVRTRAENQELQHRIIIAALLQGLTYEATAELAGVHPNTARNVEKRAAADPNSKLEIRPDGRLNPETREMISQARKHRKEGKSNAEIAETFGTDVETVDKLFREHPARDKAKRGKGKKKTPARRKEPTEDLAANDGVPDLHQRALEHLGRDAEYYDERHELAEGQAHEAVEEISSSVVELLDFAIYGRKLAAAADARLDELLRAGGEEDVVEEEPVAAPGPSAGGYEAGEILSGTVLDIEPDEVLVELLNGDRGVIGASDEGLTWHGQPDEGEEVRVEVNGFDSERDLFELGLVDRNPTSQDESVDVVEPDLDYLSPYERHFGRGEGSEE